MCVRPEKSAFSSPEGNCMDAGVPVCACACSASAFPGRVLDFPTRYGSRLAVHSDRRHEWEPSKAPPRGYSAATGEGQGRPVNAAPEGF